MKIIRTDREQEQEHGRDERRCPFRVHPASYSPTAGT
jgi:hypothetical protein